MSKVKIDYDDAVKLGLTKECSKCHEVKSVIEFGRNKGGKYEAKSKCKECEAKYRKQYYQNNKEEEANRQRKYNQEHKEEIAKYQRNYQKQYNQTPQGKEGQRKCQRKYFQTQQGKESKRRGSQKRRALKIQSFYHPFSKEDEEFCLNYFNHRCPYTGKPLTSEIHVDHIVPLSDKDGVGATAPWNLITCNASINMSKKNKPILEFISTLPNPDEVYNRIREYIILQAKKYKDIIPKDDITLKTFNITFDELKEAV